MNKKSTLAIVLVSAAFAASVHAQTAAPTTGAAIASAPGKAAAVMATEVSAQVIGLDKTTRTLTLKGPKGRVVDLVAGEEVKNFDQIKVGDSIVARYVEAVTLELKPTRTAAGAPTVREGVARANPGDRPAAAGARQVTVLADVVALDPKASTITLKGPRGNQVVLSVQNPDQFKVVKVGDQVEATYTEALALSVQAAPAKK